MYTDHFTAIQSQRIGKIPHYHFLFDGAAGKLEALLAVPDTLPEAHEKSIEHEENVLNAIAVICHPHPLHEGTMHNKVTYMIAKTLTDLGIPTLRFNFRGVEQSQGVHADGIGERDDLNCAIEKMKQMFPNKNLWLGGFSFGAYISISVSQQQSASQLISVAPPVKASYFKNINPPQCPWLVLQGLADEVVNAQDVIDWCTNLAMPPELITYDDIGHYFHRRLPEIKTAILNHIKLNHAQ